MMNKNKALELTYVLPRKHSPVKSQRQNDFSVFVVNLNIFFIFLNASSLIFKRYLLVLRVYIPDKVKTNIINGFL